MPCRPNHNHAGREDRWPVVHVGAIASNRASVLCRAASLIPDLTAAVARPIIQTCNELWLGVDGEPSAIREISRFTATGMKSHQLVRSKKISIDGENP